MAVTFIIDGGNQSTRRKPQIRHK